MEARRRLLIVNPNTSTPITETIEARVRAQLGDRFTLRTVTAAFGFRYIASRAGIAVAGHAVLDAVARALADSDRPDAILLACFGDPGFDAVSEVCDIPVVGFAEAGLHAVAALPGPFIAATRGEVWREVILELAQKLGVAGQLAGVETIDHLPDDPTQIAVFLETRAREAGASRVLVGGAGLIPRLGAIAAASRVPVLDAHHAAIDKVARCAESGERPGRRHPVAAQVAGLSGALEQLLAGSGLASPAAGD
ncbi:aspartate/glutamate racemase family protein [Caulobacter sp. LARHSG274]